MMKDRHSHILERGKGKKQGATLPRCYFTSSVKWNERRIVDDVEDLGGNQVVANTNWGHAGKSQK